MIYFVRKFSYLLMVFSALQFNISGCFATPQNLADEIKPTNLLHHNSFSNPLIFVDGGTFMPGKGVSASKNVRAGRNVSESDLPLTGALSISVIPLTKQSLFKDTGLIPDDRKRFLAELGLSPVSPQQDVLKQGLHLRIAQVRYGDIEGVDRPVFYGDILINQQTGDYAHLKDRNKQKLHVAKHGSDFQVNFCNEEVILEGRLALNGDFIIDQLNSSIYGVSLQTFGALFFKSSSTPISASILNLSSLNIRNQAKLSCQTLLCNAMGDDHAGFMVNEPSGRLDIEHKMDVFKGQFYNYGTISFAHGGMIDLHDNTLFNLFEGWNPLAPVTAQGSGIYTGGLLIIDQAHYILNRAALNLSGDSAGFKIRSKVFENEPFLPPALFVNAEHVLEFETTIHRHPDSKTEVVTGKWRINRNGKIYKGLHESKITFGS